MTTQVNEISIIPGIPLGFYDVNGNKQFDPTLPLFLFKPGRVSLDFFEKNGLIKSSI